MRRERVPAKFVHLVRSRRNSDNRVVGGENAGVEIVSEVGCVVESCAAHGGHAVSVVVALENELTGVVGLCRAPARLCERAVAAATAHFAAAHGVPARLEALNERVVGRPAERPGLENEAAFHSRIAEGGRSLGPEEPRIPASRAGVAQLLRGFHDDLHCSRLRGNEDDPAVLFFQRGDSSLGLLRAVLELSDGFLPRAVVGG